MADTARGLTANQWTDALDLRVRQVSGGSVHQNMTDLIEPPVDGRLQILSSVGSFLAYRLLDSTNSETERGAYPDWMVVSASLVIPRANI